MTVHVAPIRREDARPLRGPRHRHRYRPGDPRPHVRAVHAGRQLDDAALRRQRSWPGDRQGARRAHGRRRSARTASPVSAASSGSSLPLPKAPAQPHPDAARAGRRPRAAPLPRAIAPLLLVVEDSPVNRVVAVSILERWGYHVHVVNDGREGTEGALDAALRRGPDGLPDARRRRLRGHAGAAPTRAISELPHAGDCDDRSRDGRRPRALPRGRDGRLPHKPFRSQRLPRSWSAGFPATCRAKASLHRTDRGRQKSRNAMLRGADVRLRQLMPQDGRPVPETPPGLAGGTSTTKY